MLNHMGEGIELLPSPSMGPFNVPEPSAPLARKQFLSALDEKIIPMCEERPRLVWGEAPLVVPEGIRVREVPIAPLSPKNARRGHHALDLAWPPARVNSLHLPYLAIVFEGEADLRVGTTVEQANAIRRASGDKKQVIPGCHIIGLPALSVIVFPPGVPYSDGSGHHWERPGSPNLRIFWMRLLPNGVSCHQCRSTADGHVGEFPLLVKDPRLPVMAEIFMEEMRGRQPGFEEVARSQFVALLRRMRRRLMLDVPTPYNSAWNLFTPLQGGEGGEGQSARAAEVVAQVDSYLEMHLREAINIERLSRHIGLSPTHLNRLVQAATGTSLMRYVTRRRLEAARHMLSLTDLTIREIAVLCGYEHLSHFSQAFRREFNTTPRQMRGEGGSSLDGLNP